MRLGGWIPSNRYGQYKHSGFIRNYDKHNNGNGEGYEILNMSNYLHILLVIIIYNDIQEQAPSWLLYELSSLSSRQILK